jgi:acetyl-CoA acetyltransferase
MIGAGTETMTMIPMGGNKIALNPEVFARDENIGIAYGMGLTAEKVAEQWKVSREDQDAFAVESHRRAVAAIAGGEFKQEILPYTVIDRLPDSGTMQVRTRERVVENDEGPRPDSNLAGLAKLKPVFAARGSVTAGNSSQMSDGAGAVVLMSERMVKQLNLKPLARFVSFAVESHRRASAAIASGEFKQEILPYTVLDRLPDSKAMQVKIRERVVENDEGPRPDTTLEGLARLKPVFAARGSVTAGNSSQMSDGAGAVVLMSERMVKELNLKPLARFVSFAVAGVPARIMGIGPIAAIPKALELTGLKKDDIDWFELNEAFAAQSLAVIRDLDLNPAKINPLGGAIALGHPLGATGAIRVATLVHGMRRRGGKYGMVTMCIGTGMGAAGVFEAL